MKKFITFKILRRIVYVIAIMITLFFVKENWYREPIYSTRLKIASLVSSEAEFFNKERMFGIYESYRLVGHLDDMRICQIAKNDRYALDVYLDYYIDHLSFYAKKNVYMAKKFLLELSTYRTNNKCPNEWLVRRTAQDSIKNLLNGTIFNLTHWIDETSFENSFDYNFYYAKVIIFYIDNGYFELARKLINDVINKNKHADQILINVERDLSSEGGGSSYDFIDGFNYLMNHSNNIHAKNYYKYKLAEAKLRENEADIEAMNTMNDLANDGNGDAILYLLDTKFRSMPLEFKISYLKKAKYQIDNSMQKLARLYKNIDPSYSSYYTEEGCRSSARFSCKWLLAITYFENKKYDKARVIYNNIFEWTNPAKYGNNGYGVSASKSLGDIYYQGLGIRQDLKKAKEYYGIACDALDQDACTLYKEVNEKL